MSTFGNGVVDFVINLEMPLPAGKPFVTATATDPGGNTSELSPCLSGLTYIYLPFVRR